MAVLDENEVVGACAAIRFHLQLRGLHLFTAEQVHEQWNPWPQIAKPIQLTQLALKMLEASKFVKRVQTEQDDFWCIAEQV